MHYEKASAELITFVNGCFIITDNDSTSNDSHESHDSPDENGFGRHYFAARNRR